MNDPTLEKYRLVSGLSPAAQGTNDAIRATRANCPRVHVEDHQRDSAGADRGRIPLSDRLWNFSTGVFYKLGRKPWRLDSARDGVCYIGLAYKRANSGRTACCAAQLFLDSGDGLVFVGDFGPWYSEERKEFHLTKAAAHELLKGALTAYAAQGGRPLREVFLHARSGLDDEFAGFCQAYPDDVNLVGIRIRKDRLGPRLFRHDAHPDVSRRGMYPVPRGVFWQRTECHGFLLTSGFKERIAAYDGGEVPVSLSITLQHGEADLVAIARDVLALSKANYNACQLGESEPASKFDRPSASNIDPP